MNQRQTDISFVDRDKIFASLEAILKKQEKLEEDVCAMKEIIVTWNDAKGFVNTVRKITKLCSILTIPITACVALWFAVKHGYFPPSGSK